MDQSATRSKPLNRFYTYLYRDEFGVPIYVGKGCGYRAWDHLLMSRSKSYFRNKLQKMIRDGYDPQPEFICKDVDEEFALFVEQEFISKYGRKDLRTGILLNLTNGGDGLSGKVFTETHRMNLSAARKNRITSDITRAKMSNSQKGRNVSDETKRKISDANTGHVVSEETKRKISLTKKLNQKCKKAFDAKSNP